MVLVAVSLAVGLAVGGTLVWELGPPSPGFVEHVIFPAGTVLRSAGFHPALFTVPPAGGVLVGAAYVDHTSLELRWCPVDECLTTCPLDPLNQTYSGPSWTYSVRDELAPGQYVFGTGCLSFGNATFTQPLEIVTP